MADIRPPAVCPQGVSAMADTLPPGCLSTGRGRHPPTWRQPLKRAERILLKCILVTNFFNITSNYHQIWRPNSKMSLVLSSILEMFINKISIVDSVRVDDWTAELPTSASNEQTTCNSCPYMYCICNRLQITN